LIEVHGCLGGVWMASLLSNIIDHEGKTGIMKEIIDRFDASDAQYTAKKYDAELMKWTFVLGNIKRCRPASAGVF